MCDVEDWDLNMEQEYPMQKKQDEEKSMKVKLESLRSKLPMLEQKIQQSVITKNVSKMSVRELKQELDVLGVHRPCVGKKNLQRCVIAHRLSQKIRKFFFFE